MREVALVSESADTMDLLSPGGIGALPCSLVHAKGDGHGRPQCGDCEGVRSRSGGPAVQREGPGARNCPSLVEIAELVQNMYGHMVGTQLANVGRDKARTLLQVPLHLREVASWL
jgi:hypothetical protein